MTEHGLQRELQLLLPADPSPTFEQRVMSAVNIAIAASSRPRRGHRARSGALVLPAAALLALAITGAAATVRDITGGGTPQPPAASAPPPSAEQGGAPPPASTTAPGVPPQTLSTPSAAAEPTRQPSPAPLAPAASPTGDASHAVKAYPMATACPSDDGRTLTIHTGQRLEVYMHCMLPADNQPWSTPSSDNRDVLPPADNGTCASPTCVIFVGASQGTAHVTAEVMCEPWTCTAPRNFRITVEVIA